MFSESKVPVPINISIELLNVGSEDYLIPGTESVNAVLAFAHFTRCRT
jgi:hypothetical protein